MALLSAVAFRWMPSVAALTAAVMMASSVAGSKASAILGNVKVVDALTSGLGEGEGDLRAECARIR